jgi:hypothetical protein
LPGSGQVSRHSSANVVAVSNEVLRSRVSCFGRFMSVRKGFLPGVRFLGHFSIALNDYLPTR